MSSDEPGHKRSAELGRLFVVLRRYADIIERRHGMANAARSNRGGRIPTSIGLGLLGALIIGLVILKAQFSDLHLSGRPRDSTKASKLSSSNLTPSSDYPTAEETTVPKWHVADTELVARPSDVGRRKTSSKSSGKKIVQISTALTHKPRDAVRDKTTTFTSACTQSNGPELLEEEKLAWIPRPGKYLLMYCVRGQISNRLLCMRNHIVLAGLLNRTLLVPYSVPEQHGWPYDLGLVWDVAHTRDCLGDAAVLTIGEYQEGLGSRLAQAPAPTASTAAASAPSVSPSRMAGRGVSVRLQCWHGPPAACGQPPDTPKDLSCPGALVRALSPDASSLAKPGERTAALPIELDRESHLHKLLTSRLKLELTGSGEVGETKGEVAFRGKGTSGLWGWLSWGRQPAAHSGTPDSYPEGRKAVVSAAASCLDSKSSLAGVVRHFGKHGDDILVVGDLVDREILHPVLMSRGGHPFRHLRTRACSAPQPLLPAPGLIAFSKAILRRMMANRGGRRGRLRIRPFLSLHWRRGDFVGFCYTALDSDECTYPPRQAANCTVRHAERHGLRHIFLATNARTEEVSAFKESVRQQTGGRMRVHQMPSNVTHMGAAASWLRALPSHNTTEQRELIEVVLEKLLAAQAMVFLGSVHSTFTKDIQALRQGLGHSSCFDSFVCLGEKEDEDDDSVVRPLWVTHHLLLRRLRRGYGPETRMSRRERELGKRVVKYVEWLMWKHSRRRRDGRASPRWMVSEKAWQGWKSAYPWEPGTSPDERRYRRRIVEMIEEYERAVSAMESEQAPALTK